MTGGAILGEISICISFYDTYFRCKFSFYR